MRIDASGNLLVGKTVVDSATAGCLLTAGGEAVFTKSGAESLTLNRQTSDGIIVSLRKDNTTVGSIGSISGVVSYINLDPRSGGTGIGGSNTDSIIPVTGTGAVANGTKDLGLTTARWRDLYLSGGVYLGGTGAANKLEDYETGTWTPVLSKSTTAPTVTYTTQTGTYTKVGRMIYVSGLLSWTAISGGTGDFHITNLPFTLLNSSGAYPQLVCVDYNGVTFGANDTTFGGYGNTNTTYIVLLVAKNNATNSTVISGLAGSGFMYFNLTYQVA
jgi:hypothetical protein